MLEAFTKALTLGSSEVHLAANLPGGTWSNSGGPGGVPFRSPSALARLWATNPWARLACDVVAAREAAAAWFLLLPKGSGGQRFRGHLAGSKAWQKDSLIASGVEAGDVELVVDHPFLNMQTAGTQGAPAWIELPGGEVDRLERVTLDLLGSFYYVLFRDPQLGIPVRWWPISPLWIDPPNHSRPSFLLRGQDIDPEDVAWYRQPRPDDPYGRGSGVAGSLDHDFQINESTAAYQAALLRNRGRPDLLIMAPGLGPTEFERFENQWRSHQGPRHAGYAHFVGYPPVAGGKAGIMVKDLSFSPADLKSEEGQKARRDTILQVWRVPPAIIGQTESSNRSTAREAESFIRTNRITPDLEARRGWLQTRFFEPRRETGRPEYEGDWILGYELPPLDPEQDRVDLMTAHPEGFRENEVRSTAGLPPVEGGNDRMFSGGGEAPAQPDANRGER